MIGTEAGLAPRLARISQARRDQTVPFAVDGVHINMVIAFVTDGKQLSRRRHDRAVRMRMALLLRIRPAPLMLYRVQQGPDASVLMDGKQLHVRIVVLHIRVELSICVAYQFGDAGSGGVVGHHQILPAGVQRNIRRVGTVGGHTADLLQSAVFRINLIGKKSSAAAAAVYAVGVRAFIQRVEYAALGIGGRYAEIRLVVQLPDQGKRAAVPVQAV